MRIRTLPALCLTALVLGAGPALADGKIYVQLPDLSSFEGAEAEALLRETVTANIISSNCADFAVTDAEWSLLVDSADMLAYSRLGLDTNTYDTDYYKPSFALLDDDEAGACAEHGPAVEPTLEKLVSLGGSRDPLPNQESAAQEYEARRAAWDAAASVPKAQSQR